MVRVRGQIGIGQPEMPLPTRLKLKLSCAPLRCALVSNHTVHHTPYCYKATILTADIEVSFCNGVIFRSVKLLLLFALCLSTCFPDQLLCCCDCLCLAPCTSLPFGASTTNVHIVTAKITAKWQCLTSWHCRAYQLNLAVKTVITARP